VQLRAASEGSILAKLSREDQQMLAEWWVGSFTTMHERHPSDSELSLDASRHVKQECAGPVETRLSDTRASVLLADTHAGIIGYRDRWAYTSPIW
jgi:hypothetical protein